MRTFRRLALMLLPLLVTSGCGVLSSYNSCVGTGCPLTFTFSPALGPVGSLITLTGTDFSSAQSVTIGGSPAIVVSLSTSALVAFVMPGTPSGTIQVTMPERNPTNDETFTVTPTGVPAAQQGTSLVGTGGATARQGWSVALSADGNTALIGGPDDTANAGATWVFVRSGIAWSQQGDKLVGTGATGAAQQGYSTALSADGNTAVVGGPADGGGAGAVWIFTRSGGTWTQQGTKLVSVGSTQLGSSVAVSADGNTVFTGTPFENANEGGGRVFARSGNNWTQQGAKLVGTGATGSALQGYSVALSADGNTVLMGGINDDASEGAAWVFTRSGGSWNQQGSKLVGTGGVIAKQGWSTALSADGNTALVGGALDDGNVGAAWIFSRSGGTWTQQGGKLVGTGATGTAQQGYSAALSADGNTAVVGGPTDSANAGALWTYTRTAGTWSQSGGKLVGTGGAAAEQGWSVAISADGKTGIAGGQQDNGNTGAAWIFTE